jgi:hypothetical protein
MTLRMSIQDESCNKSSRGFVSHEAPRPEPELISHELISHAYLVLCFPSSFNPSLHLFPNLPINLHSTCYWGSIQEIFKSAGFDSTRGGSC